MLTPSCIARLLLSTFVLTAACGDRSGQEDAAAKETAAPSIATPQGDATRGRSIFVEGVSPSGGTIEAILKGDVVLEAKSMPCIGCHGEDGRGRPEGGMKPSNITWEVLSKPYGGQGEDGRQHAAYDLGSLSKAITMGIDPSGNQLLSAMPRYRMSRQDLADLTAFIQVLGRQQDTGSTDTSLTVATILPQRDPSAKAVAEVLDAYFDEVNALGGIYGRSLELAVVDVPTDRTLTSTWLEQALAKRPSFAVLVPHFGPAAAELLPWLADAGIPVLGPLTHFPEPGVPPARSVFYVDGGLPAQALALAEHAAASVPEGGTVVVVTPGREPELALAERVRAALSERSTPLRLVPVAPAAEATATVEQVLGLDPSAVLVLGPAEGTRPLLEGLAADEGFSRQTVLVPGSLPFGDPFSLPLTLDGRLVLAYPWTPEDVTPAALADYRAMAQNHGLPQDHRPAQFAALAATKLLIEGLMRAGRGVTRRSLVDQLEGLRDYPTGLTPPLSYGPNRRIGVEQVRLVSVDMQARTLVVQPP